MYINFNLSSVVSSLYLCLYLTFLVFGFLYSITFSLDAPVAKMPPPQANSFSRCSILNRVKAWHRLEHLCFCSLGNRVAFPPVSARTSRYSECKFSLTKSFHPFQRPQFNYCNIMRTELTLMKSHVSHRGSLYCYTLTTDQSRSKCNMRHCCILLSSNVAFAAISATAAALEIDTAWCGWHLAKNSVNKGRINNITWPRSTGSITFNRSKSCQY